MHSLQALVALCSLAAYAFAHPPPLPPGPTIDKCKDSLLILTGIVYDQVLAYSSSTALGPSQGNVTFQLTNSVVPYTTNCVATSTLAPEFFTQTMPPWECDLPSNAPSGAGATFMFDQALGLFQVNQTFTCAGQTLQHR